MVTEANIEKFSVQCKNIFEQIKRDVIGRRTWSRARSLP